MAELARSESAGVEEEERLLEGVAVLDFDMLCSTVAMQVREGKWAGRLNREKEEEDQNGDVIQGNKGEGGVLRRWEGELLNDCFDDRRIAIQSSCCPCYRFGKNMRRAGFGPCFLQGSVYLILAATVLLNVLAFMVIERKCFLYLAIAFSILTGAYLGFHRTRIRKKFNIRGSDSSLEDCVYHMICPCCSLCQESRTLEINNVQDGIWHGRGDTICIGNSEGSKAFFELSPPPILIVKSSDACSIPVVTIERNDPLTVGVGQSPLLLPTK